MKKLASLVCFLSACIFLSAQNAEIQLPKANKSDRVAYSAEYLQKKIQKLGLVSTIINSPKKSKADFIIRIQQSNNTNLKKEGFKIDCSSEKLGKNRVQVVVDIVGNDGTGCIYACNELAEQIRKYGYKSLPNHTEDAPEMVLRGGCIGVQKPYLLPGRQVYEYPYTPELFPWFYDKKQWIEYLDMLVENRMNSLYLWNGHPFASLVKLSDYPFALEVDEATFQKNKDIFAFLTKEADRRGIFVIQMFYNILVSKPFADHYGIKTQDRHRPIDACDGKIRDYTYKSIKAFIENYPNVGLLVCLGEAMDTYEDDVEWMTKTIIPAVKDGLTTLKRTDEPPILLRAHDTDCKMVMEASLPIYKNLYTMNKYTGESLTTYTPQGPWAETHRSLAALGSTHISNIHILANLEPWRWSSPDFIQKTVNAMHNVHHANALHLYPQASYWDWPYTADTPTLSLNGKATDVSQDPAPRLRQLDRDWMWYSAWGRYAWNCHRDRKAETIFWDDSLARVYGTSPANASFIRTALEESGEIAPKLLRRFGITEGNRQSLLLGMFCSQIVNPYKYTIYPGFYESCGPDGLKLIDYVARQFGKPAPVNTNFPTGTTDSTLMAKPYSELELPLDIVDQCTQHGDKAAESIDLVAGSITKNNDEFLRLQNDMHCYKQFAHAFALKVKACEHVLNYKYNNDLSELHKAVILLEKSLDYYRELVKLTDGSYLYCQSMQTSQRRIPIGGDDGKMKEWNELLPKYEQEFSNLKKNLAMLESSNGEATINNISTLTAYTPEKLSVNGSDATVSIREGKIFSDLDSLVSDYAPELQAMKPYVVASGYQRNNATTVSYTSDKPFTLLVGYFRDDQRKYAQAPKLEIDATASEYGQQEPCFTSALRIKGMPQVNVHPYNLPAGTHTLNLPKGFILVLGATTDKITPRDAGLAGADSSIDWLFY